MSKWPQFIIGVFAAGAVQFGILVGAGVTSPLILTAGTLGTMGTTAVGLLKQLPRDEWPPEKRDTVEPTKEPA